MKIVYLIAAIAGAVIPYIYFVEHIAAFGFGIPAFIEASVATPAATGITADLLISSFVFWVYMVNRFRGSSGPNPGLFIVLNLLIGLSCALPAYLYALETRATSPATG